MMELRIERFLPKLTDNGNNLKGLLNVTRLGHTYIHCTSSINGESRSVG